MHIRSNINTHVPLDPLDLTTCVSRFWHYIFSVTLSHLSDSLSFSLRVCEITNFSVFERSRQGYEPWDTIINQLYLINVFPRTHATEYVFLQSLTECVLRYFWILDKYNTFKRISVIKYLL